jgi:hypothetical protein
MPPRPGRPRRPGLGHTTRDAADQFTESYDTQSNRRRKTWETCVICHDLLRPSLANPARRMSRAAGLVRPGAGGGGGRAGPVCQLWEMIIRIQMRDGTFRVEAEPWESLNVVRVKLQAQVAGAGACSFYSDPSFRGALPAWRMQAGIRMHPHVEVLPFCSGEEWSCIHGI